MTEPEPRAHGQEAWLGYTFTQLRQIADRAARYCRWGDRFAAPERFEIAWAGLVDHLTACEAPPEPFELYKAAQRAIGRASSKELNEHGLTHGGDGLTAMPRFEIYWAPRPAPPADATVVDRIAMWQIWATLRPLHKLAFLALAAHDDYAQAAQAIGYPYSTFTALIWEARAEFLARWHEGERPSRIWACDRHGTTDIEDRVRRVMTAKRHRNREHQEDAGPTEEPAP
jgi:hypothetical protein